MSDEAPMKRDMSVTEWDLGRIEEIPEQQMHAVRTPRGCVMVFAESAEQIRAFRSTCPHAGADLSTGYIKGAMVMCPFHGWQFNLRNGENTAEGLPGLTEVETERRDGQLIAHFPQVTQA